MHFHQSRNFQGCIRYSYLYILRFPAEHVDDGRRQDLPPHQLPDVQVFSGFHPELPLFISPVKDNNDQLCTILFYFGNILFQLFFPAKMIIQLIDSYQPYFDTLYFCNSSLIIAKMKDIRCIQSLQCIIETFLTIVMAVIICCINSFYRACCKYICVGSGCLKGKLLVFSFRRFCKSSFKICNCQVILRKNTFTFAIK